MFSITWSERVPSCDWNVFHHVIGTYSTTWLERVPPRDRNVFHHVIGTCSTTWSERVPSRGWNVFHYVIWTCSIAWLQCVSSRGRSVLLRVMIRVSYVNDFACNCIVQSECSLGRNCPPRIALWDVTSLKTLQRILCARMVEKNSVSEVEKLRKMALFVFGKFCCVLQPF